MFTFLFYAFLFYLALRLLLAVIRAFVRVANAVVPAPPPILIPEIPGIHWHFHTKIHGVSFSNRDGSSRQAVIRRCSVGERLLLIHEPTNPVDPNAVAICRTNGEQLGYLSADLAERFDQTGPLISDMVAQITAIGGGTFGKPTMGVNIRVGRADVHHHRAQAAS